MPERWEPSGAWLQQFRGELRKDFGEIGFDLLLADFFGYTFADLSPAGPAKTHDYRLLEVLRLAKSEGWLLDLLAAAHQRRPKNATLTALATERGLTLAGPRIETSSGTPFEALVEAGATTINIAKFYERLPVLEGQVCWIHVPGGGGTGFLVGPALVLTNYHVIEPVKRGQKRWQDVTCRFDFKQDVDGNTLERRKNTVVKLDPAGWFVDGRPASAMDWNPALGDAGADELDFALLRLAERIGELPVGGDTADAKAPTRGWITATDDAPMLEPGNQLVLIQHPSGAPLQMSIGPVSAFNPSATRLRHKATSKDGSSGSPCFTVDLQLAALHHAHDPANPPQWNQAIPLGLLQKVWRPESFEV